MRPIAFHESDCLANYRAPKTRVPLTEVTELELAAAWDSLATRRDAADGVRRITVLRPFTLSSGA